MVIDTSGAALAACEGSRAFLLKPSLGELEALVGRPLANAADQVAGARTLLARGFAEALVVSLGDQGALLVTADAELRIPAIEVPVVSAVGAGDAMVAAIAPRAGRGPHARRCRALRSGGGRGDGRHRTDRTRPARRHRPAVRGDGDGSPRRRMTVQAAGTQNRLWSSSSMRTASALASE